MLLPGTFAAKDRVISAVIELLMNTTGRQVSATLAGRRNYRGYISRRTAPPRPSRRRDASAGIAERAGKYLQGIPGSAVRVKNASCCGYQACPARSRPSHLERGRPQSGVGSDEEVLGRTQEQLEEREVSAPPGPAGVANIAAACGPPARLSDHQRPVPGSASGDTDRRTSPHRCMATKSLNSNEQPLADRLVR